MKNRKILIILLITLGLLFITTGTVSYYRYSINGKINATAGNYTFNVSSSSTTTKEINLGSNLKPYDKGSFKVTVNLNDTDSDVYYKMKINRINLPKGFKFLAQDDNISPFSTYSKYFKSNESKTDTVTIYWYWDGNVDDEDDNSFIGKNISANIVINSKQTNPAYMKNGYSLIAPGGTEFWNLNYRPYIRTINFGNDLSNLPSSCNEENLCWDITESGNNKVYGYLIDSGLKDSTDSTKSLYNLYIVSRNEIFAPSDCGFIFSYFTNLVSINFNNFNTTNVTNMGKMFLNCISLTNLNLSYFNTTNLTNMSSMFTNCKNLEQLNIENFDTSNVHNMRDVFSLLKKLKELNLSNFDTSSVTDMWHMFADSSSLISLDLSNFNTSNVTNMECMFQGLSLTSLDLSNFNTKNVTTMNGMFLDCTKLTNLNLSNFNTSKVTDMSYMFDGCSKLKTTINILNANTAYTVIFFNALTDTNANVTIGYTTETKAIAEAMKETAGSNKSKITLKQI